MKETKKRDEPKNKALSASDLISKASSHLMKYFPNEPEKNRIRAKFQNISGKTGRYYVSPGLFQNRTPRKNRALIPFAHVVDQGISYEQLDTFENGIVVEFVNHDYFDQLLLPESQQNSVFKKLKSKLGSDDNVSAILNIRSTGSSSSSTQRYALSRVEKYLKDNELTVQDSLIRRKQGIKNVGCGNDKWEGFLHYSIQGGQQDTINSHKKYGISYQDVKLFNPSVEYANEKVSQDITLVLFYFALFSIPGNRRNKEWYSLTKNLLQYFKTRVYGNVSLKEYVGSHISLNVSKGKLIDPIQIEPITIEEFALEGREADSVDLSHQNPVNHYQYTWDEGLSTLLSPANPTNVFWAKHSSNMMQQNDTLEEFFEKEKKRVEIRSSLSYAL